jgi:hypothetical protein
MSPSSEPAIALAAEVGRDEVKLILPALTEAGARSD